MKEGILTKQCLRKIKEAGNPRSFHSVYFALIYPFDVNASAQSTAPPAAPRTVLWDRPINL